MIVKVARAGGVYQDRVGIAVAKRMVDIAKNIPGSRHMDEDRSDASHASTRYSQSACD
jgi:hypothetical protein